jgi:hypothetical protein
MFPSLTCRDELLVQVPSRNSEHKRILSVPLSPGLQATIMTRARIYTRARSIVEDLRCREG